MPQLDLQKLLKYKTADLTKRKEKTNKQKVRYVVRFCIPTNGAGVHALLCYLTVFLSCGNIDCTSVKLFSFFT